MYNFAEAEHLPHHIRVHIRCSYPQSCLYDRRHLRKLFTHNNMAPQDGDELAMAVRTPPADMQLQPLSVDEPRATSRSKTRLAMIVFALCLSMFTVALDLTIVATALPAITSDLRSAVEYSWIGSAHTLAGAASCTIWTRDSDTWGRKMILLITVAWFFVGSIIAGVSTNVAMLIASRALQGTAGGRILPMVIITISDLFSLRKRSL